MAADVGGLQNQFEPMDVNRDGQVEVLDALAVINYLRRSGVPATGESGSTASPSTPGAIAPDVNGDTMVEPLDALLVINHLRRAAGEDADLPLPADVLDTAKADGVGTTFSTQLNAAEKLGSQNLLTEDDVGILLRRASMATSSEDAIIAVVDRAGRILGVRVEAGVSAKLTGSGNAAELAFAIDGAVAKARTAAFFSSSAAPLTSRTIRFISQSTITQREVESSPLNPDSVYRGPGLVAPIGVGGHFPPEIPFTPQVDLFAIEHQSRDARLHSGADGLRQGKVGSDDFYATTRFNADPAFVPGTADEFFRTFPDSYGAQSGTAPLAAPRGIATLPGGVPLFKVPTDGIGNSAGGPNLVGGIGVFFPGEDGFATYEQGFQHASERGGSVQSEAERTNAPRVLEAEAAAFLAAAGDRLLGVPSMGRDISGVTATLPPISHFGLPVARIDLVGITLEIYGPHPNRNFRQSGIDRLISVARNLGSGADSGSNQAVEPGAAGRKLLPGQSVPEGWLVAPHDSKDPAGLKAADVEQIIRTGIASADRTRAAIRLTPDFRPGAKTQMVLAVADTDGDLLGLFRMPDATIFSIDVAVAKARNVSYYADAADLALADRVDHDGDGVFGTIQTATSARDGDTLPLGTALTNRSIRFLSEPRFPTGIELPDSIAANLNNDPNLDLCDQKGAACTQIGPFSALRLPGINPQTAENIDNQNPLAFELYASPNHNSVVMFDSFQPSRNLRDPGDASVLLAGTDVAQPLANQNGVVFFPGSTPLYVNGQTRLAGGFGVSGDGVDQDDVVTAAGQVPFEPLQPIRIDTFTLGGVRVPFQKFNRNPFSD